MSTDRSPTPVPAPAWLTQAAVQPLPVLLDDAAVQEALGADLTVSALAALLRRDPPLGLRLQAMAQRRAGAQRPVTDPGHALALLGTRAAQAWLRQALARRFDPQRPGHLAYAEAVATSLLAAHWAQVAARIDGRGDHATVFWRTARQGCTHWLWALAEPRRAAAWREGVARGERPTVLERGWLGAPLHHWDNAVVALWALQDPDAPPTAACDAAALRAVARLARPDAAPQPADGALARWLAQPGLPPRLWWTLAREAMADWHGPRTRLLLRALATLRGWSVADTTAFVHRQAAEASRGLGWAVWIGAPAARLLWERPPPRRPANRPAPPTANMPASVPAAAPVQPPLTAAAETEPLRAFLTACQQQRFEALAPFLQAFGAALQQALGLRRFALLMRTTDPGRLVCIAAHGFDGAIQPRRLQVELAHTPLLQRLLQQPGAFLRVRPAQVPEARAQLPPPLDSELTAGGVALAALTVRGRAAGVLWADAGPWGQALDDARYLGFKRVVLPFARELTRLLVRQQARGRAADPGDG